MYTAIIFAAGRGERLRPHTDTTPKPLLTINNIPAIVYHVKNLVLAGFTNIIINHAYLGYKIKQCLGDGSKFGAKITYFAEPPGGLETAGTIVQLLPIIKSCVFITINADIFTDYDFKNIYPTIKNLESKQKLKAHLVLVPKPINDNINKGDFSLNSQNIIHTSPREYIYSGIAAFKKTIFNKYNYSRFSITPILRDLAEKELISGEIYNGVWCDIAYKIDLLAYKF